MGTVYLGREPALDREVAVKALPLELAGRDELRERFRREAKIAAKLSHPNIVPLHTFGEIGDVLYYVMGFVRGESLAERMERAGAIEPEDVTRILAQLADALSYAHEMNIVHRDIKPENVLLDDRTGRAILTDFGIAKFSDGIDKLTQTGGVLGTPHYMSPEQATGRETDSRSDLYSLGVLGYRMLTGRLPIESESLGQLIAKHSREEEEPIEPLDGSVPRGLAAVVMRCLRKQPSDRPHSAREVVDVLGLARSSGDLPEELRAVAGVGFWLIPAFMLALFMVPLELLFWPVIEPGWRILVLGVQVIPFLGLVMAIGGVVRGRDAGLATGDAMKLVMRAPDWYWGWVPEILRPPDDLWLRLPGPMRQSRVAFTLALLAFPWVVLVVPMAVMGEGIAGLPKWAEYLGIVCGIAMNVLIWAMVGFAVREALYLKRKGFDSKERSRIATLPSRPSRWRDPQLKSLLRDAGSLPDGVGRARTPAEQLSSIRMAAGGLPVPLGEEVSAAAHRLFDSIRAREKEKAGLVAARDPEELGRLEARLKSLEGAGDSRELSMMMEALARQRDVLMDIELRLTAIGEELRTLEEELSGLWKAVAASRSAGDGRSLEVLRRQVASIERDPVAVDESTTVKAEENTPTVVR
jgi:uncharacterized membrane protein YhdT/predicted Ser/Thr protein kinase